MQNSVYMTAAVPAVCDRAAAAAAAATPAAAAPDLH
jgi:hypothetical protein